MRNYIINTVDWGNYSYAGPVPEVVSVPTCPTTWRLKTIDETGGVELHVMQRTLGGIHGWYNQGYVEFRQGPGARIIIDATSGVIKTQQHHEFPNNGCARSWCSRCGVVGLWNWQTTMFE